MDTKALRQKILDLAIRGKLVPQDPNDEPASMLLGRIRQQKQQMVKEGKLKPKDIKNDSVIFVGEDNLHYEKFADGSVKCIEDEVPFDLPDGWAWARLTSICLKITDGTHHSPDSFPTGEYKYVTAKNIKLNGIVLDDITYVTAEVHREIFARCNPEIGDILYIKDGATSGIATVNTLHEEFSLLSSVALLKPAHEINNWYMCYAMQSPYFYSTTRGDMKGVGITRITLNMLASRLIPVPPQNEQQRISVKSRGQIDLISSIESDKGNIVRMVFQAKAKILDLAIRGQLVPQDPDDEPASVLLERIRAEKEELIKQGKIKRDKKESVIFRGEDNSYYEKMGGKVVNIDDEIPFELPESWAWCRGYSCFEGLGSTKLQGDFFDYIDIDAIDNRLHCIKDAKHLPVSDAPSRASRAVKDGSVLFSLVRPYLENIAFVEEKHSNCIASTGFYVCNSNGVLLPEFMFFLMISGYVVNGLNQYMKGDNSPSISKDNIENWLYPVPPIGEQQTICAKLKTVFTLVENVEKSLN